jgi:G:T/U-mismatch repair DNA glycosylase
METMYGVKGTLQDGIFFTEESIPSATAIQQIKVEISRQNSNLMEVKARMAAQAKQLGANAIMSFKYGQKPHKWYEQVFTFKWDTESWHGEGVAVKAM